MASSSAMFSGLSGLSVHSRNMEVIGNNIANVNTPAFKTSRLNFETQISRIYRNATSPGTNIGGTNPYEVGQGVSASGTSRMMTQGQLNPTGNPNDLAIDGEGLFVVQQGEERRYTRAGALGIDGEEYLTSVDGQRVLGYAADENFVVGQGALEQIRIPVGSRFLAEATSEVRVAGNLNAAGDVATTGSVLNIGAGATGALSLIAGGAATLTSALTAIADTTQSNAPLFQEGQFIELQSARKGSASVPASQFEIGAGSTLGDFVRFLTTTLGVRTDVTNPEGQAPGGSIDPATGAITLVGNAGEENNIEIDPQDFRLLNANGEFIAQPFGVTQTTEASGESVRTSFIAYDSLGNEVNVGATLTLEGKTSQGTTWRYWLDSPDSTPGDPALATGTLRFDPSGKLINNDPVTVSIDRTNTGSATPLTFSLFFGGESAGAMTSLADVNSSISTPFRDGRQTGVLEGFGYEADGTIVGAFSNGLTRTLGQVPLAMFTNPAGLVETGSNSYRVSTNSGDAQIVTAGQAGSGSIQSGALEQSNVDLGKEFIGLILTSTGYSASSRVIRTADELLQQLLSIGI